MHDSIYTDVQKVNNSGRGSYRDYAVISCCSCPTPNPGIRSHRHKCQLKTVCNEKRTQIVSCHTQNKNILTPNLSDCQVSFCKTAIISLSSSQCFCSFLSLFLFQGLCIYSSCTMNYSFPLLFFFFFFPFFGGPFNTCTLGGYHLFFPHPGMLSPRYLRSCPTFIQVSILKCHLLRENFLV